MHDAWTEADFERLSWHDCGIWRIDLAVGEPTQGDWTSDLILGIDFIVEWVCGEGESLGTTPRTDRGVGVIE